MKRWIPMFAGVLATGCTFYRPMNVTLEPIGPKEEAVAVVKGESTAAYVLFFGPFGNDSLGAALEDARDKAKADSMTNVFVERKVFMIPGIYTRRTTMISGTAIRYLDASFDHAKGPMDAEKTAETVNSMVKIGGNKEESGYMNYAKSAQEENNLRERRGEKPTPILSFEEWRAKGAGKK